MNLTQNPLQSEATESEATESEATLPTVKSEAITGDEVLPTAKTIYDPSLEKAKCIYDYLQEDIQKHLIDQYIKPQLRGDDLIKEFDKLIESEACQRLEWQVLTDVVEKIIENKSALAQMCEKNPLGFKHVYHQHFIQKKNTFVLFDCPVSSMCAEFVMRKWH
jgi:hypothetical protein